MKRVLGVALLLAVAGWAAVWANGSIEAEGEATGDAVLWFLGNDITAEFSGTVSFTGSLLMDDRSIEFSAGGTASGSGSGDMVTLAVEAWIFFVGTGTTSDDEPLTLRGGLTINSIAADLTGTSVGTATGSFHATALTPTLNLRVSGEAEGAASGAFVAPDDPTTMQVQGTAVFTLHGTAVDMNAAEGAVTGEEGDEGDVGVLIMPTQEAWPDDLLARLLDLLETHTPEAP